MIIGVTCFGDKEKIVLSAEYRHLEGKIGNFRGFFGMQGELLYAGRNCLKLYEIDSYKLVVKKYRTTKLTQILSLFKKSKARKSFYNGIKLCELNINTPQPVAYMEIKSMWGFVKESYYICRYIPHSAIGECYGDETNFVQDVITDFAKFAAMLHERGVIHKDLNSTNVRFERNGADNTVFWLIDINRMKFAPNGKPFDLKTSFKNLTRFSCNSPMFEFFVRHYLKARNIDEKLVTEALLIKETHDKRVDFKKKIKQML